MQNIAEPVKMCQPFS